MPPKIAITTSSFGEGTKEHLDYIARSGVDVCRNTVGRTLKGEELLELAQGCVGIIAGTEQYCSTILKQLNHLKVISRCGAGTDSIDLSEAEKLGIRIFNTPDAPTRAVAELVIGLSFDLLRHISLMDRRLRQGSWDKKMGRLFQGKQFGIIGMGRIGREVAKLARLLEANVSYYDPFYHSVESKDVQARTLTEILKESDIVTIHVPLTPQTTHMLGAEEFSLMKPESLLIHCSRGGVVHEEALIEALEQKKLAGAAVDVFEQEPYNGHLKKFDQVILTPHIGSYAQEARIAMEMEAVHNLMKGLNECRVI